MNHLRHTIVKRVKKMDLSLKKKKKRLFKKPKCSLKVLSTLVNEKNHVQIYKHTDTYTHKIKGVRAIQIILNFA